jgi:hypothetical protein
MFHPLTQNCINFINYQNLRFLDSLKNIKHKIVIAGNHEVTFDPRLSNSNTVNTSKNELRNCIYLEDDYVEILGLKIFGSPW